MAELTYLLTYADVPFVSDRSPAFRIAGDKHEVAVEETVRKYQPLATLYDVLNEKLPFQYLSDFVPQPQYLGRNLGAIASHLVPPSSPNQQIKIGQFFYPNHAARWAVGRFVATSAQVKEMVTATGGGATAATFKMKAVPVGAPEGTESDYTVETSLYMLPPRPLAEHGGGMDGLFLVTLVDERYKWQYIPVTLWDELGQNTTWEELITVVGTALGVSISVGAFSIQTDYGQPEQDSQLWTNAENAAALLDAIAWNIGKTFVRTLDGRYYFQDSAEANTAVETNLGGARIRIAGGDLFSTDTRLPAGDLSTTRNAVVPAVVKTTFPKYVQGDDPVPHMVNPRYVNQRPSSWYEESYGETFDIDVPILSGGPSVSGITGVGTHTLQDTAKGLYSGEVQLGADPLNVSGLTALAMAMAQDYWGNQAYSALDEVYPGTYAWEPEGLNDILWTYSAHVRQASVRVMRSEWNAIVRQYQHATPALAGYTNTPRGVGGPSVAQTWRDTYTIFSGSAQVKTLTTDLLSGGFTAALSNVNYLPTDQRWVGRVENEDIVFEGTSGGATVGIVYRGVYGTQQVLHGTGNSVQWLQPNTTYGVNLATHGKGFLVNQGAWKSGGISEAIVQCPLRTVQVQSYSGTEFGVSGILHYSGIVNDFDPSQNSGSQFLSGSFCWVQERNGLPLASGTRYGGQLAGYSISGRIQPIYLVNAIGSGLLPPNTGDKYNISGKVTPTLNGNILAADTTYSIDNASYLPTENRWLAKIDNELMLMEGTSGGINTRNIVQRGFNGTTAAIHSGAAVLWQMPDQQSGINLTTFDKGFFAFYGGVSGNMETVVRCPIRTVHALAGSGVSLNGYRHFSGKVCDYDPSISTNPYVDTDLIWIVERNNLIPTSGLYYNGQLTAFSVSGAVAPVYAINTFSGGGITSTSGSTSGCCGNDIGFKYYNDSTTVGAGQLNKVITGWNIEWDTHSFYKAASGGFIFLSGSIGKYHAELYAQATIASLSGTASVGPAKMRIYSELDGIQPNGAEDCGSVWSLVIPAPGTGTGISVISETEVCLQTGWHFNITDPNTLMTVLASDAATVGAEFTYVTLSVQKVNKAGTVQSGSPS